MGFEFGSEVRDKEVPSVKEPHSANEDDPARALSFRVPLPCPELVHGDLKGAGSLIDVKAESATPEQKTVT